MYLSLCIRTYHVRSNYVTYIVAMRPYLSQLQQFRRLLCAATMSSLAQLRVPRWILRSRGKVDTMTRGWPRAEMPETCSYSWCHRITNQQRMAARRALEWIGTSKARLVFRYKISDVFPQDPPPHTHTYVHT